jgi:hypothetical protein
MGGWVALALVGSGLCGVGGGQPLFLSSSAGCQAVVTSVSGDHEVSRAGGMPRLVASLRGLSLVDGTETAPTVSHLQDASGVEGKRGSARLRGTLWWVVPEQAAWSAEQWAPELDSIQSLGMDTLILNGPYVGAEDVSDADDPVQVLFREAARRKLRIFVDTLAAPEWWKLEDAEPEIARAKARIERLERRYGRFESFAGFYIPYELYVMWDEQARLIRTLYREVAAACKATAPARPVLISPFFILDREGFLGDFRWAEPDEYEAFWRGVLREAAVDIVALQDSGEHLSFYTMEQRRPFLAAMKSACEATGKTFWVNVETGELAVEGYEDYVRRFGRKTHVNSPATAPFWRAVPAEKLRAKLELAGEFSDTAITWGYREFVRPSLGPAEEGVYRGYREVLATSE